MTAQLGSSGTAGAGRQGVEVTVVLAEGGELRGNVQTFNPRTPSFVLRTPAGSQTLMFEAVKSVSFARDAVAQGVERRFPGSARLVTVRFRDGATLDGIAENFGGPRAGVFLVPLQGADVDRVYVPVSAVTDVVSVQNLGDIMVEQKMVTREAVERAVERQRALREETIGEILLQHQAIDREQLDAGLSLQRERKGTLIGQILVEQGYITPTELKSALELQKRQRNRKLGEVMIDMGCTSQKLIGIALSIQYNLPFVTISPASVDPSLRDLLRREEALEWQLLPLSLEDRLLTVALADPVSSSFRDVLERRTGAMVAEVIATALDIQRTIDAIYPA